jgi:predicted dehydrogenase
LAVNAHDVSMMLQTADRAQRTLLVASKFRHVPEIRRARALLRAGELGQPVSFGINFCSPVDMRARWNAHHPLSGGGVIMDNGWHAFDIVTFLFGSISRVQATDRQVSQGSAVEDSATLQVWAGDGVVGRVELSWSSSPLRDSYLVVHGRRGSIEVGWHATRTKRAGGDWEALGGSYDKLHAHRAMHERFIAAIAGAGKPWISASECLQAATAVDAAYRSLASGTSEWVTVDGVGDSDLARAPGADGAQLAAALH